jgi:hypothetical protein
MAEHRLGNQWNVLPLGARWGSQSDVIRAVRWAKVRLLRKHASCIMRCRDRIGSRRPRIDDTML